MKSLLILVSILFFSVNIFAQTTVEIIKKPQFSDITDCADSYFINADTGWVIISGDDIVKTVDGGNSYDYVTPNEGRFFRRLFFVNDSVGWGVCRYKGMIMKTVDGAESWINQTSDSTSARLYSIYAVDEDTVFVGGQSGSVLKTVDGGVTWTNQITNITATINEIYAFDGQNAILIPQIVYDDSAKILVTNDGGATWTSKDLPVPEGLEDCSVLSVDGDKSGVAYVAGASGTVYKTIDFGKNWVCAAKLTSEETYFGVIKTNGGNQVWAGASDGVLYYSSNAGIDWSALKSASSEVINDLHVFDDSFIILTDDQWFISQDNGQTYNSYSKWTSCDFQAISSYGDKIMAVTTKSANITISNDAGTTWSDVSHITNAKSGYLHNVFVSCEDTAIYVGNYGQIGYSVDGGSTWSVTNDSSNYNLFSIGKVNTGDDGADLLLAGGDHGLFFYSNDVAAGWNAENTGFDKTIKDMFGNNEKAYAVFACDGGSILKAPFDGEFVEVYHDSDNTAFNAVDFIDDSIGFVVGNNGLILKTTDSGENWTVVDTIMEATKSLGPRALTLLDIHFINANTGFICASDNTLLQTDDAGDTWTAVDVPNELNRIVFFKMAWVSDNEGYIAASDGYLLKVTVSPATKIVDNSIDCAAQFELLQNYPNPFNPTTTIKYSLSKDTPVSISIYNTRGQVVANILNKYQKAGNHSVLFDAQKLSSGLYFYKLTAGNFVSMKKMLLIK